METTADECQFESTQKGRRVLLANKMCQFRLQREFAQMTLGHHQQIKMINIEQKSIRRRHEAILKRKNEIEEAKRISLPSPTRVSIQPHRRLHSSAGLSTSVHVYTTDVARTPIRPFNVGHPTDVSSNSAVKMTEVTTFGNSNIPRPIRLRRFHSYAVPPRSYSDLAEGSPRAVIRPQIKRSYSNLPQSSFSLTELPRNVCPHPVNSSVSSASLRLASDPEVATPEILNSGRDSNELPTITVQREERDSLWNTKSLAKKTSGRRFGVSGWGAEMFGVCSENNKLNTDSK